MSLPPGRSGSSRPPPVLTMPNELRRLADILIPFLAAACGGRDSVPGAATSGPADLVVTNAVVWSGVDGAPRPKRSPSRTGESPPSARPPRSAELAGTHTRVIDAGGGMVVPGFIDAHIHFIDGGLHLASVQLRDARTPAEFVAPHREFAGAPDRRARGSPAATGTIAAGAASCPTASGSTRSRPTTRSGSSGSTGTWRSRTRAAMKRAPASRDDVQDVAGGEIVRDAQGGRPACSKTTRWR